VQMSLFAPIFGHILLVSGSCPAVHLPELAVVPCMAFDGAWMLGGCDGICGACSWVAPSGLRWVLDVWGLSPTGVWPFSINHGGKDVLKWSWEPFSLIKLVEAEATFEVFSHGCGYGPYHMCKPIWWEAFKAMRCPAVCCIEQSCIMPLHLYGVESWIQTESL